MKEEKIGKFRSDVAAIGGGILNRAADTVTLRDWGNMMRALPFIEGGQLKQLQPLATDWFESVWLREHCRVPLREKHGVDVLIGRDQKSAVVPCSIFVRSANESLWLTSRVSVECKSVPKSRPISITRRIAGRRFEAVAYDDKLHFAANPAYLKLWNELVDEIKSKGKLYLYMFWVN